MAITRRYQWRFRNRSYHYEQRWSREVLRHLESLRHDIKDTEDFWYYVYNDPYSEDLLEFLRSILMLGEDYEDLDEPHNALKFLLSFVQHLNYYRDIG
mgnify:FL=1